MTKYPYVIELWLRGNKEVEYKVDATNELVALVTVFFENKDLEHCLCETGAELKIFRGDVERDLDLDYSNSDDYLEEKYGDRFPRDDWKYEVKNGDTNLGYFDWLRHRIESEINHEAIKNK